MYSKTGELRFDDLCMEGSKSSTVKLQKCSSGNQKQIWKYDSEVTEISFPLANILLHLDETNETYLLRSMSDC